MWHLANHFSRQYIDVGVYNGLETISTGPLRTGARSCLAMKSLFTWFSAINDAIFVTREVLHDGHRSTNLGCRVEEALSWCGARYLDLAAFPFTEFRDASMLKAILKCWNIVFYPS